MKLKMLAVLVFGALFAAGAGAQEKGKTDEDKIQGTWKFVSVESMGMEVTQDFLKEGKVVFATGRVKVHAEGNEMETGYKLDPAKKPKQIDITEIDGGGKVLKGIYLLDGDTLKFCFAPPGNERPTEFTTAGSIDQLIVLKRDKQ